MDRLPPAPSEDRHRDDAEDCMPPTPKTLARLQDDPLLRFLKRGQIDAKSFSAALAIRRAVEVLSLPLRHRAMRAISTATGTAFDPLRSPRRAAPVADLVLDAQRRYKDRVHAMKAAQRPVGPVLDVIVNGHSCRAVDVRRRRHKGRTAQQLVAALDLYVDIARHPRRCLRPPMLPPGQKT